MSECDCPRCVLVSHKVTVRNVIFKKKPNEGGWTMIPACPLEANVVDALGYTFADHLKLANKSKKFRGGATFHLCLDDSCLKIERLGPHAYLVDFHTKETKHEVDVD
jgi:hypothetical protein